MVEVEDVVTKKWDINSIKQELSGRWSKLLTIFVPCLNEEKNICNTLDSIFQAMDAVEICGEVLIVDDASSDKTSDKVIEYKKLNPHRDVRLLVRDKNIGIAQNYIDAAFIAKGKYYKLVGGDNAEPTETLVKIFKLIGQADMIVPYHTKIIGRKPLRHILSKMYTFIVNTLTGNHFKYYNGGAVHLTYNVMRWQTDHYGYSFQADIIARLVDQGMNFIDVPVFSQEIDAGNSQAIVLKNFLSVGHLFLNLPIRRIRKGYRSMQVKKL